MEQYEKESKLFKAKMWDKLLKDTVEFIKKNIDNNKKDEAKSLLDFLITSSQTFNN